MTDSDVKLSVALIDLLKALLWPLVVLYLFSRFRVQIVELLSRLGSFKVAGGEFVFQQPSGKARPAERQVPLKLGPDGFLTINTVHAIVLDFALLEEIEPITGELLFFQTPRQRTWLVATTKRCFIVLDDEKTRQKRNLVQTLFGIEQVLPLDFGISRGSGIVKFAAENTWWFYSRDLFGTSEALTNAVRRLVGR